jgi:hypothetical protein
MPYGPQRSAPNYIKRKVTTLKTRGPKRGVGGPVNVPVRTVLHPLKSRKVARPNTNAY